MKRLSKVYKSQHLIWCDLYNFDTCVKNTRYIIKILYKIELTFHTPFLAWKKNQCAMKDHDGGGPLRACWRYQAKIRQAIKVVSQTTKLALLAETVATAPTAASRIIGLTPPNQQETLEPLLSLAVNIKC